MDKKDDYVGIRPKCFSVGERDNAGEIVERIYYKSQDFVVYRTSRAIRIDYDDDSSRINEFLANHGKIAVELARLYSWLPEQLTWSEPINRQIARSLAENAKGEHGTAKVMLAHAEKRIIKLKTINGRLQYTISSFIMTALVLLIVVILSVIQSENNTLLSAYYNYSIIAFCGALGGVISVALGFPKLEIDIDANVVTNCLIGASRIIISIAAAIFSYFALKSGVAFSFLANGEQETGVYVIAMVAGFSEMLIPNIMTTLAGKEEEEEEDEKT